VDRPGPAVEQPDLLASPPGAGDQPSFARPLRRLWRRYKRLTALSWPTRFPIVQFPNLPLTVAFISGRVAQDLRGSGHAYAMAISYLAMTIWAYAELTEGVNWFRRLLGLGYVISTAVHLALALQR
jgi:hypothetical protein